MIKECTIEDRDAFRVLWFEYMQDQRAQGSKVHASPRNLDVWTKLYFEPFVTGQRQGLVLLAENEGVLMWGDGGQMPFESDLGRLASCLGTYVRPEARQQGLSYALRALAKRRLAEMGFHHGMGSGLAKNEVGIMSGFGAIGFEPYEVVGLIPFRQVVLPTGT